MERPFQHRPFRADTTEPAGPVPGARGDSEAGTPSPHSASSPAGSPAGSEGRASKPSKPSNQRRAAQDPSLLDRLKDAGSDTLEIVEYAKTLIGVRADQAVLKTQRTMAMVALGVLGGIAAIALVLTGVVRFAEGLSGGFAELFGDRLWAGQLATGVLFLGGLAGGAAFFVQRQRRKSFEKTRAKYEQLHAEHRARFGHHAIDSLPFARGASHGGGVPGPRGGAGAPRGPD